VTRRHEVGGAAAENPARKNVVIAPRRGCRDAAMTAAIPLPVAKLIRNFAH
jgi:hypothetical protein